MSNKQVGLLCSLLRYSIKFQELKIMLILPGEKKDMELRKSLDEFLQ